MTLTVTILIWGFSFVTRGGPFVTQDKPRFAVLRSISRAKWTEYVVSATLLHVVVNSIAGVINTHELVLLYGYTRTVVSMILVQRTEDVMDRIESSFPNYEPSGLITVDYERPSVCFVFLRETRIDCGNHCARGV